MSRSSKGFTIIEMLVALAIIGVIATLIFDNMPGSQPRYEATCYSGDRVIFQGSAERVDPYRNLVKADGKIYTCTALEWRKK